MDSYKIKNIIVDDSTAFSELHQRGYLSEERKNELTISCKNLLGAITNMDSWKRSHAEQKKTIDNLQKRIQLLTDQSRLHSEENDKYQSDLQSKYDRLMQEKEDLLAGLEENKGRISDLDILSSRCLTDAAKFFSGVRVKSLPPDMAS